MTTATLALPAQTNPLWPLARVEAKRYLRHPAFLLGLAGGIWGTWVSLHRVDNDIYNEGVVPAFFLGIFGMVACYRLARSLNKTEEAAGTTPISMQTRTAALCLV